MILRARTVLPISVSPIDNGAVLVRGKRIVAVGRWRELRAQRRGPVHDLEETTLMPGLINAHCHLDYTHMAGHFPPPKHFTDWLKAITETKSGWSLEDYRASWQSGAQMLLRTGTTTVADIEAVPELLPQVWTATPLRVISLLEMISITQRRPPQPVLAEAVQKLDSLRHSRCRVGLSPHAPYSTVPELLRLSTQSARSRRWLLASHLAESAAEFQMFKKAGGEMFDWLKRSGRDMSDCGSRSPVQHAELYGLLGKKLLAIHVNHLARNDAALLGKRQVSVVHCPRSHAYFRHTAFPIASLRRAGVNVCLGTDSLATVCRARGQTLELDMFEEMRALARAHPTISPRSIVEMATVNGARALGLARQIGHLSAGAFADVIAVPVTGKPARAYDALVEQGGQVRASFIEGRWVIAP